MSKASEQELLERILNAERVILRLETIIMAFIDDANTKLTALQAAIAAIPAPSAPPDPATIVPIADQQTVLAGIDAATTAATAKA